MKIVRRNYGADVRRFDGLSNMLTDLKESIRQ
jgi:hypothetical protein